MKLDSDNLNERFGARDAVTHFKNEQKYINNKVLKLCGGKLHALKPQDQVFYM